MARRHGLGPAWLRGLLALPAFVLVGTIAAAPVVLLGGSLPPSPAILLVATLAQAIGCIAFGLAAWPLFSGTPLHALGFGGSARRAASRFGVAAMAGIAGMSVIVGIGLLAGAWRIEASLPDPLHLIAATVVMLAACCWEEIAFRGVMLQEAGRRRLAVGLLWSTLAFTLVHLGNPGALETRAAQVLVPANIALASLVLAAAFLLAGDLWWPWGLHFGWNWAQACLFGLPVSGFEMPSLMRGIPGRDPAWLTGASFGPEASAIATVVVGGLAAVSFVLVRRRRPLLPVVAFEAASQPSRVPHAVDDRPRPHDVDAGAIGDA